MNATMRSFAMGMLPGAVSRAQFPQAQKEPNEVLATLTDGTLYIKSATATLNGNTLEVK